MPLEVRESTSQLGAARCGFLQSGGRSHLAVDSPHLPFHLGTLPRGRLPEKAPLYQAPQIRSRAKFGLDRQPLDLLRPTRTSVFLFRENMVFAQVCAGTFVPQYQSIGIPRECRFSAHRLATFPRFQNWLLCYRLLDRLRNGDWLGDGP